MIPTIDKNNFLELTLLDPFQSRNRETYDSNWGFRIPMGNRQDTGVSIS